MRVLTRDKLSQVAMGDQEIIRFFEQMAKQTGLLPDGDFGDFSVSSGIADINAGAVGLDEVSADVLDRSNHTGVQPIDSVDGLTASLNWLQSSKQDTLVSGGNIKTVNGESLLGSGDVAISGGLGGVATLTIPGWRRSHKQTVAAVGVTPAHRIFATLGAFAATDINDPELLDISAISVAPGTDQITITAAFASPASGPIPINWSAL